MLEQVVQIVGRGLPNLVELVVRERELLRLSLFVYREQIRAVAEVLCYHVSDECLAYVVVHDVCPLIGHPVSMTTSGSVRRLNSWNPFAQSAYHTA